MPTIPTFALILPAIVLGQSAVAPAPEDLSGLSLEQLMSVEVTSASKRSEALFDVPAAIYVITADDIRRSGLRSIPDLLRRVPGLDVSQETASKWMVSARGFKNEFSNKLLVLVDGRSVYSPLYAGVYWDSLDLVLQDVDRIEVIRGPGGAIWGANAVNGVINIITKSARETQGGFAEIGGGNADRLLTTYRYGGKVARDGYYRVWGRYREFASLATASGGSNEDAWRYGKLGFRMDLGEGSATRWTIKGDTSRERLGDPTLLPTIEPPFMRYVAGVRDSTGSNLLARATTTRSNGATDTVQAYFSRTNGSSTVGAEARDTFDIELQRQQKLGSRNSLVFGAGHRTTYDRFRSTPTVAFVPASKRLNIENLFAQNETTLTSKARLTLGAKLERNDYTGWEFQPTARATFLPSATTIAWAAISRAVHTPSRLERSADINGIFAPGPNGLPMLIRLLGGDFRSERLTAYEAGLRWIASPRLSVDAAAFYNDYGRLRSLTPLPPYLVTTPSTYLVQPVRYGNGLRAQTGGLEVAVKALPSSRANLNASYSLFTPRFRQAPGWMSDYGTDINYTPRHQASAIFSYDAGRGATLTGGAYYYDAVPAAKLPTAFRFDLSLLWKLRSGAELTLSGLNLFGRRRAEAAAVSFTRVGYVEPSFYAGLTLRFP